MADELGRAPGIGTSNDSDPSKNPAFASRMSSPRSEEINGALQIQSPRIPDLVRDSKLETHFLPDSSIETVHTYHEPDYKSRRRLVSRSEHWRRYGKIGGGSFGSVWLEKCINGERRGNGLRAIKQMEVRRQSTRLDYNRELEAIAKFSHWKYERAFVKSFGWYESPEHLFIAMEYLELGDLHTYLHHKPPLPEPEAKEITFQILDGLFLMHDNEFAHRDMKPRNILLKSCPPDEWWVKIADFGISKRIEDEIGLSSTLKGTLGYIAPELHGFIKRGSPYAPDIWAVGEIAFQMLTKQSTFKNLGVLFKYMSNLDLFPSDQLAMAHVSESGRACVMSLLHPNPLVRTTAEVALEHAWFNEALPSRHGSMKSIRNGPLLAPLTDAGTEELATWNTRATHESAGSLNHVVDPEVGTWNTNATHEPHDSTDIKHLEKLRNWTSTPLSGYADVGVDESIQNVGGTSTNSQTGAFAQGNYMTEHKGATYEPQSSTNNEHLEENRAWTNTPLSGHADVGVDEDVQSAGGLSTEKAVYQRRRPQDNGLQFLPTRSYEVRENVPIDHQGPTVGQINAWDFEASNDVPTVVPMPLGQSQASIDTSPRDDDEPETFIAQRLKEIMNFQQMREMQDSKPQESAAKSPNPMTLQNAAESPTPWESGITSTSERVDWQSPGYSHKQSSDRKSKMTWTFKDMVKKWRSKDPHFHLPSSESPQPGYVPNMTPDDRLPYPPSSNPGPPNKTFGITLMALYSRNGLPVPDVAHQCMVAVEKYGLDLEGIYRQSEKPDILRRMMADYEHYGPSHDLTLPLNFFHNIHNAASLLKRFFRDLPVPLLTFEHYPAFIDAAKIEDDIVRRDSIHAIVNQLPDPHYAALRALALHLRKIQQHSNRNRMNYANLAILFGPTLTGGSVLSVVDAGWQVQLVETILVHTLDIFDEF